MKTKILAIGVLFAAFALSTGAASILEFAYEVRDISPANPNQAPIKGFNPVEGDTRFLMVKSPRGVLKFFETEKDKLNFAWMDPGKHEAVYDSATKAMNVFPLNPQSPLLRLEDFVCIYWNPLAYFEFRRQNYEEISYEAGDDGIRAYFPKFEMLVRKSENNTVVEVLTRPGHQKIYSGVITENEKGLEVEYSYGEGHQVRKYVLEKADISKDLFQNLAPPVLEGMFVVSDFRLNPPASYLHSGDIPDLEFSKSTVSKEVPEVRLQKLNSFLRDEGEMAPVKILNIDPQLFNFP